MELTDPLDGLGPQLLVVLIEVAPYIFRFRGTSGAGNGSEEAPGLGEEVNRTVSPYRDRKAFRLATFGQGRASLFRHVPNDPAL